MVSRYCGQSIVHQNTMAKVFSGQDASQCMVFTSQSTIFQSCWYGSSTKQRIECLAQGHSAVPRVRLEPATPQSQVKPSTTEPPCSLLLSEYSPAWSEYMLWSEYSRVKILWSGYSLVIMSWSDYIVGSR